MFITGMAQLTTPAIPTIPELSRDGYRDQIVTSDVRCVSVFQDTVHVVQEWHVHSVMHSSFWACFLCFFYNLYICPL